MALSLLHPPEYYRQSRKESHETVRDKGPWTIEAWEHAGYGYIILHKPQERQAWLVVRQDLQESYGVAYQFWTPEHMEERIAREGWRPHRRERFQIYEQLTLGI